MSVSFKFFMKEKRVEWTYREWKVPTNLDSGFMLRKPLTKEQEVAKKALLREAEIILKDAKWKQHKNKDSF